MFLPLIYFSVFLPPLAFHYSKAVTAGVTVSYEMLSTCIQNMLIETELLQLNENNEI